MSRAESCWIRLSRAGLLIAHIQDFSLSQEMLSQCSLVFISSFNVHWFTMFNEHSQCSLVLGLFLFYHREHLKCIDPLQQSLSLKRFVIWLIIVLNLFEIKLLLAYPVTFPHTDVHTVWWPERQHMHRTQSANASLPERFLQAPEGHDVNDTVYKPAQQGTGYLPSVHWNCPVPPPANMNFKLLVSS